MEHHEAKLECEARFELINDDKGPREPLSEWFSARLELYQARHLKVLDGKDIIFGHGFVDIAISFEEAMSTRNEYDFLRQVAIMVRLPNGKSLDFRILKYTAQKEGLHHHVAFAVASYTTLSNVLSGD